MRKKKRRGEGTSEDQPFKNLRAKPYLASGYNSMAKTYRLSQQKIKEDSWLRDFLNYLDRSDVHPRFQTQFNFVAPIRTEVETISNWTSSPAEVYHGNRSAEWISRYNKSRIKENDRSLGEESRMLCRSTRSPY